MPEALMARTTSPGPGTGSGNSWISSLRSPRKTTPRMAAPSGAAEARAGPGQGCRDVVGRGLPRARVDLAHDLHDGGRHRRGHALLAALVDHVAVHVVDLRAPPLDHVLRHRGPPVSAAPALARHRLVDLAVDLGLRGIRPPLGGEAAEAGHAQAKREADPRRLLGEANRDLAPTRLPRDLRGAEPGHRLHGVAHRVLRQLGPALAPQVVRWPRAVDHLEHRGQLLRARGDRAVVLSSAEHVVAGARPALHPALDLAGLPQGD